VKTLCAAAAAGGAVLLTTGLAAGTAASAAPAGHTAPAAVVSSAHTAGYTTGGGRHFRFVQATVQVPAARTAAQQAEVMLGGAGVSPVFLGVKAGGGASSVGWAIGLQPFGMGGGALSSLTPAVGDMLRISIFYDQSGHVYFTAVDTTKGASQTVKTAVNSGSLYTAAEAAVYETGYTSAVTTGFKLWAFTGTQVTTYSGVKGTLLGSWTTDKLVAVSGGVTVMSPSVLQSNGQAFGVWRR
jgi:hypothetical protein